METTVLKFEPGRFTIALVIKNCTLFIKISIFDIFHNKLLSKSRIIMYLSINWPIFLEGGFT